MHRYELLVKRIVIALIALALPALALAKPQPSFREYVAGPWGQIHVRVSGRAGDPTVILIHKMVWSSVQFEKVQPLLAAEGVRSIAVDLPGYGLSDGPELQPTADQYADALLPILTHFHLKTVSLLGVDTGATIAAAFAARYPDRVQKLILDGPPLFDPATAQKLLNEPRFDRAPQPNSAEFAKRLDSIQSSIPPGSLSDAAMHEGLLQFFLAGPNYWYGHHAVFSYDLRTTLLQVHCPTLILNSKGSLLNAAAKQVHSLRPDFSYVELEWPGMMVSFDAPDAWSAAVSGYLTKRP